MPVVPGQEHSERRPVVEGRVVAAGVGGGGVNGGERLPSLRAIMGEPAVSEVRSPPLS